MANALVLTYPNPPTWTGNGVTSVSFLGNGGEVAWSPDGSKIAFDRRDGSSLYQLHTINPDGTGEASITLGTNAPASALHKGWPSYHPSGSYIVCQVEQDDNPQVVDPGPEDLAEPGRGWWNNVWVCAADGSEWWQLTDYAAASNNGVLVPRFSPDGTKLLWAKKIGGVSGSAPLGVWNLQLADFAIVAGVPTISNVTTLTPGSKTFYEAHGFNRDSTKILFCADPDGHNLYSYDIYSAALDGSNVTNLTNSEAWDEHAHIAKHGDYIAYMSSQPYPTYDASLPAANGLKSETYVMAVDGSNKRRLTGFNIPGFAEYDAERSVATSVAWNPTGTQLVVCQLMLVANYDTIEGRRMWLVTLDGAYS